MKGRSKSSSASPIGVGRRTAKVGLSEGTVQEFLGLTDEEAVLVRTKAALAVYLHQRRTITGWSQTKLAEQLGSGQSRVAKIEAAHPSVSLDLMIKALLVTGATMTDIGAVMATGDPAATTSRQRPSAQLARRRGQATTAP